VRCDATGAARDRGAWHVGAGRLTPVSASLRPAAVAAGTGHLTEMVAGTVETAGQAVGVTRSGDGGPRADRGDEPSGGFLRPRHARVAGVAGHSGTRPQCANLAHRRQQSRSDRKDSSLVRTLDLRARRGVGSFRPRRSRSGAQSTLLTVEAVQEDFVPVLPEVGRLAALCVACLFGLAIAHKATVLLQGKAATEPLLALSSWRSRHASVLVLAVIGVETVLTGLLLVLPRVGFAASAIVFVVYSRELRRLPDDEPCGCLGQAIMLQSARSARRRNLLLIALAVAGAIWTSAGGDIAPYGQVNVGVAALLLVALLSPAQFRRSLARPRRPVPMLSHRR
jgi:hypothetical protein